MKQADFAFEPDERHRRCLGPQQCDRMRIKRDRESGHSGRVGPGTCPGEQSLVPAMDPVEVADGYNRPPGCFGYVA